MIFGKEFADSPLSRYSPVMLSSNSLTCLLAGASFLALTLSEIQAQQDASPLDTASVLYELDQAEAKQTGALQTRRQKLQGVLQGGLANGSAAAKLYEDATRELSFIGKSSSAAEFSEWRKNNAALLRSERMQSALRLHLRYLLLGLQQTSSEEAAAKMPALYLQYARELSAFLTTKTSEQVPKEAAELLNKKPARESLFARWLELPNMLPHDKQWEPFAGNLNNILETNVRAPLRSEKDPQILAAWDLQMDTLGKLTQLSNLTSESENLQKNIRPQLLFARANDKILVGQVNSGQKDMLQIIRDYPQHPNWANWVTTLRNYLKGPSTTEGEKP